MKALFSLPFTPLAMHSFYKTAISLLQNIMFVNICVLSFLAHALNYIYS